MNRDNWTRAELKSKAKVSFKRNYWLCVAVALIITIFSGSLATAGRSASEIRDDQASEGSSVEQFFDESDDIDADIFYDESADIDDDVIYDDSDNAVTGAGVAIVGAVLIIVLIVVVLISSAVQFFLINPLMVGCQNFFYKNDREKAEFNCVGRGFNGNYLNVVKICFIRDLKLLGWTLLLIVPGIIKSYEYSMIPYILAENPDISTEEAFERSRMMMDGQKWDAFILDWSFILWDLLAGITLGIAGIFYVFPYICQTHANLYACLKGDYCINEIHNESDTVEFEFES